MSSKLDIQIIKERADKLDKVKGQLKEYFVGIDNIIDEFIDNVKIWYILPEVQTRPLICCLWGLTGVGKTDLIRKFVNLIDFNDRFIEIQMDTDNSSYYKSNVQDHIESVLDNANEEGILLLDEMQRFRTVDEKGSEIRNTKYNDLWMLLSDGKFESDSKNRKELFEMMFDIMYYEDERKFREDSGKNTQGLEEEVSSPDLPATTPNTTTTKGKNSNTTRKYKTWTFQAKRLKKLLKIEESIEEIMTWDEDTKIKKIQKGLKSKTAFEGNVYSKLLVVVSGNLDEAFKMSNDVGDVDTDADVFYEFSRKVNILNIKKSLSKRFKPEQIARFGNIHIIYPSLNKESYYKIIERKIAFICSEIYSKHKISIKVDKTVCEVIYNNGVFPTQGVRPVLSTISSMFENSLPTFIYNALFDDVNKFSIKYAEGEFYSIINGKKTAYKVSRVIENIKNKKDVNEEALIAVHEAGHAIAYALLFKFSPIQIVCKTADDESQGFIGCHDFVLTKQKYAERIMVSLAGKSAEKLVFGENNVSSGSFSDIRYATQLASTSIKKLGLGKIKAFITTESSDAVGNYCHSTPEIENVVEKMLEDLTTKTEVLISNNKLFLKKTIAALFEQKELKPSKFVEIAKEFVPDIKELHFKEKMVDNFEEKMFNFLK